MKKLLIVLLVFSLIFGTMSCSKKEEVTETSEPVTTETETVDVQETEVSEEVVETTEEEITGEFHPLFEESYPFTIMINNHHEARPQSGLTHAKIIYEMLVESRITRYLMIIDDKEALVGPIRSARPSYIDLVREFDGIYAHVGNAKLVPSDVRDFDQFFHGAGVYYREDHRVAPHNMYANLGKLYESAQKEGIEINLPEEGLNHFNQYDTFQDLEGGTEVSSIKFTYDNYTDYDYHYDAEKRGFLKSIDGVDLIEEFTGEAMVVSNFFIISLPDKGYMPNGVHRRIEYVGEGDAKYFSDGQMFDVTWKKETNSDPLKFYKDGKEIILQPGLTFINFVQDGMTINVE